MRISDWSSDVCSSDLTFAGAHDHGVIHFALLDLAVRNGIFHGHFDDVTDIGVAALGAAEPLDAHQLFGATRPEEHTSEFQSPMRISYVVFCSKNNIHLLLYNQSCIHYIIKLIHI